MFMNTIDEVSLIAFFAVRFDKESCETVAVFYFSDFFRSAKLS